MEAPLAEASGAQLDRVHKEIEATVSYQARPRAEKEKVGPLGALAGAMRRWPMRSRLGQSSPADQGEERWSALSAWTFR